MRDSDAYLSSAGTPTIFYQTGGPGQNNHGLDFGFFKIPTGTVVITNTPPGALSLGNYVWLDTNNDGVVNSGETGVGSVAVELYQDSNGDGVFSAGDALVGSTTTNSTGYYSFTNLAPTRTPTQPTSW